MKHFFGSILLAPIFVLATAACSGSDDSSASHATNDDYDDVAQSLGALVATNGGGGDVGSLSDSADLAVGVAPFGIQVNASGKFGGDRLGVTYDYSLTCKDGQGQTLAQCGPTTDQATVDVNWSGNLGLPNFSAALERHGQWQLSGIQSNTVTFDGNGTFSFDARFQSLRNVEREYHLSYTAEYGAVLLQRLPRMVKGGSVHYDVTAERKASSKRGESRATFKMDAKLTFDENGNATLTLDGSHHYSVNATGQVAPANQ